MRLRVVDLYSDKVRDFRGDPDQVQAQLREAFKWLKKPSLHHHGQTVNDDVVRLGSSSAYVVEVLEG